MKSHNHSQEKTLREQWGVQLLAGFICFAFTACAQAPLTVSDLSVQDQQSMARLELQDRAMFFEAVRGTPISGNTLHHADVSTSIRTLNVSPGTYHVSLVYEHLAQPKCWKEGTSTHCWKVRDRGWWLPGATLIPATVEWVAEPGETYSLKRVEDYWSMTEQPSWHPMLSMAEKP